MRRRVVRTGAGAGVGRCGETYPDKALHARGGRQGDGAGRQQQPTREVGWGITHPDRALGAECKGRAAATTDIVSSSRGHRQPQSTWEFEINSSRRGAAAKTTAACARGGFCMLGRVPRRWWVRMVGGNRKWGGRVDGGSGVKHHWIHTPTRMNESLHSDSFILLNDMCTTHRARYDDDERATKA